MKKTPHVKSTIDLIRDFGAQISDAIVRAWQIGDPNAVRMLAHLYKYTACLTIELEKHVRGGHDAFLMKVLQKDLALFLKTETFRKYMKLSEEGKSDLLPVDVIKSIKIMEDCMEALHKRILISDEAD